MEHIKALVAEFPTLLGECSGDIYFNPGWTPLLRELCAQIVRDDPECRATQIKEKFGGLRFYVHTATQTTYDLIRVAEERSFQTCDSCGKPGKRTAIKGWQCVRCDEHSKKP